VLHNAAVAKRESNRTTGENVSNPYENAGGLHQLALGGALEAGIEVIVEHVDGFTLLIPKKDVFVHHGNKLR
jgi:hypothetical protein